ncbi:MAG: methanobactin [Blastocatellia bacterium]
MREENSGVDLTVSGRTGAICSSCPCARRLT